MKRRLIISIIAILLLVITLSYFVYSSSFGYCTFKIGSSELKLGESITSDSGACIQFMRYCKSQSTTKDCKESIEQAKLMAKLENPENKEFCQEQDDKKFAYYCLTNWKTDTSKSSCSAKEVCFLNLAIKEKDVSHCSEFRDVDSCKYEFAAETGDESICPQLLGIQKEDCYYWIGYKYGKLKLCLNVDDEERKNFCIWQAVKGQDEQNRFNLDPNLYQEEDILVCNEAKTENSVVPGDCYYAFTKMFGVNICEKLSLQDKIICYRTYTEYSGDKSKCDLIKDLTKPETPTDGSIPPVPPDIRECN